MSYMEVWMYNSKPRIRVFLCYLLILVVFFIFSDIMIYLYTKSLYQPIENCEIQVANPEIVVTLAKASNVNGNIGGTIKNNTNETIENQYIKFDFYTLRDVKVGTKYIVVQNLNPEEEQQYEFGFRYERVKNVKISLADEAQITQATAEELKIEAPFGPRGLIGEGILSRFLQ